MSTQITTTTHTLSEGWHDTTYEVTLHKSDLQPSRYEVDFDGIHVGWVVKRGSEWHGYVRQAIHGFANVKGRLWAGGSTRKETLEDLAWQITRHRRLWKEMIEETS